MTGAWEAGIYDYRAVPLPGSAISNDERAGASYSHDTTKEMVSFDGEEIAKLEGKHVEWTGVKGIGGNGDWTCEGSGFPNQGEV